MQRVIKVVMKASCSVQHEIMRGMKARCTLQRHIKVTLKASCRLLLGIIINKRLFFKTFSEKFTLVVASRYDRSYC